MLATMVSSAISAVIAAVVAALVTKIKTVKAEGDKVREEQTAERNKSRELLKDIATMVCRMVIYSDKFSIDEKLDAYVIYRDTCHENHQTKTYMDEQVGMDVDEYIERHGIGGAE